MCNWKRVLAGLSAPILLGIALSSFVGYSFANTIGMPLFTGIPIRVRLYSAAGVLGSDIARVIAFTSAGFWLGVIGLAGLVLSLEPEAVPLPAEVSAVPIRALGIVLVLAAASYVVPFAIAVSALGYSELRLASGPR
jgi:uncharacterized membrane protein YbhN (UPF0104 family)